MTGIQQTCIYENRKISSLTSCDSGTVFGALRLNLFLGLGITSKLVLRSDCVGVPMAQQTYVYENREIPSLTSCDSGTVPMTQPRANRPNPRSCQVMIRRFPDLAQAPQ